MKKSEYFKLALEEQVDYINVKMKEGKSLISICSELSLAKSGVSARFINHGYELIEGQYVRYQIEEQQSLNEFTEELPLDIVNLDQQNDIKVLENTNKLQENETLADQSNEITSVEDNIEAVESIPEKIANGIKKDKKNQLKAKVGRPQKYKKDHQGKNIDKKKFTIEIDKKVYKAMKRKKTEEGLAINIFIEDLLRKAIEAKYFKNGIE